MYQASNPVLAMSEGVYFLSLSLHYPWRSLGQGRTFCLLMYEPYDIWKGSPCKSIMGFYCHKIWGRSLRSRSLATITVIHVECLFISILCWIIPWSCVGTLIVKWLEHCSTNIQVVGSNPAHTCVCWILP